jgi:hypothetical protein
MAKSNTPKRGRKRTTLTLNKKIVAKAKTAITRGTPLVRYAKEQNFNPAELSRALTEQFGIQTRRGRPSKLTGTVLVPQSQPEAVQASV